MHWATQCVGAGSKKMVQWWEEGCFGAGGGEMEMGRITPRAGKGTCQQCTSYPNQCFLGHWYSVSKQIVRMISLNCAE